MKLSFEHFLEKHEDDIYQSYLEEGINYDYDVSYESFEEDEYEAYLQNFGQWEDKI
jgi:hypothetical protein